MDRQRVVKICNKIKQALDEISKSEGVKISMGSISFSQTNFTTKITGSEVNGPDVDKANLAISKRYGFTQNVVGMKFDTKFGKFVIDGFKPTNRKYPVLATRIEDGKQYKFSPKSILNYLGGNNIINRRANLKNLLPDEHKEI